MPSYWFPRLSPAGRIAGGSTAITIVGGRQVTPNGFAPQWADEHTLYYSRHEGNEFVRAIEQADGSWREEHVTRGFNSFAALGPLWGGFYNDAGAAWIAWSTGPLQANAGSPALYASGQRAWLEYSTGRLFLNGSVLDSRACTEPRVQGDLLVWRAEDGRDVCARLPNGQVENRLNVEPQEFWPVPLLSPAGESWILTNSQTRCLLRPVGSMLGYIIRAGEHTNFPDARFLPNGLIRVTWTDDAGNLTVEDINPLSTRVDLRLTPPPPPPPTLNPPGVTIDSPFPVALSHDTTLTIRAHDRNNDCLVEVQLIPKNGGWSFHLRLTNTKGTDRSGADRFIILQ